MKDDMEADKRDSGGGRDVEGMSKPEVSKERAGSAGGAPEVVPHDELVDHPYMAAFETWVAGAGYDATHVLERFDDGSFTGASLCGIVPDTWMWSPKGDVSCRKCSERAPGAPSSTGAKNDAVTNSNNDNNNRNPP